VRGFKEVVDAHNQDAANPIEIVGEYPCKGEDELGKSAAADALSKTPDLKGIFAINDPSALGAYKALEAEGKTDQVVVVGFDGQPIGKQGVLEGKLFDTPTQFPGKMSVMVVEAIVKYFDGVKIDPDSVLIETASYRKADAEKELGKSSKSSDG
jgi:ribose transport system substrate-binding protein